MQLIYLIRIILSNIMYKFYTFYKISKLLKVKL